MSFNNTRAFGDLMKLKEVDKKEDRYDENFNALFQENGLYRKRLPKGPGSLMRAVSEALHFTPNHHKEIQDSLLTHLTQLIASNKLTPRLNNFQGNSIVLKDFANNPQLPGFEKVNLELVSLFFKVRVILYTMNDDHYLTATIYNHNYSKTIELLRTKTSHYDAIFPKDFIQKAGICQNIVLNMIDKVVNGSKSNQLKNINGDEYVNITYENSLATSPGSKESNNLEQFRITRGQHKKSLSDNFNTNFEFMEEQQTKFLDAFMNAGPPGDLLSSFKNRKDTAESGFSINANFDFIDEQNLDPPFQSQEFAIKNYPIPSGGLSPKNHPDLEQDSPMPAFSKTKFTNHPNVLFNENITLAEIERMEKNINTATTQDGKQLGVSPYYVGASPPGLSPAKFSQRSFADTVQTQSDFLSPSPTIPRDNNLQAMSPTYGYGNNSPSKRNISPFMAQQNFQGMSAEKQLFPQQVMNNQRTFPEPQIQAFGSQPQTLNTQGQPFNLHSQQYSSLYMKRVGNVGTSMSVQQVPMQSNEFNMGQNMVYNQGMPYGQGMGYDQGMGFDQGAEFDGMDYGQDMYGQGFNGMQREKKKPIILDEGKERYAGRLKFFDENKKYGFIVMDDDGSDIFVHYDDLVKAGITKDLLRTARMGTVLRLTFSCMAYIGKYNKSRKAIDIQLMM